MAIGQNIQRRPRNVLQGISLIEVMVALVVLSTGILALTLLQTSVTRAAAESKIRSLAMSYAQSELERIRAQTAAVGAYTTLQDIPVDTASLTATNIAGSVEATGTQFKQGLAVRHWIQSTVSADCGGSPPCFVATTDTAAAAVGVPDYKTIAVTVYWTGADSPNNYDKSLTAFDVMSVLSLSGSTDLITSGGNTSGSPKVIQTKASADMAGTGVIPIATGGANGEATAASNPKPLVSNSTGTAATSFTVLTYQDPNTGNILIQRAVDTEVVSCKCRHVGFSNSLTNFYTTKMRPTYWNGTFYSSPKSVVGDGYALSETPNASAADTETYGSSTTRTINQDQDACDTCCRDHHDPSVTGVKAKFDPYMSSGYTHKHYNYPLDASGNPTGTPTEVVSTNTSAIYSESCRLIRVDGLWRAAVDLNQEHMNLLATNQTTTSSGSPPVTSYAWGPTTTATANYVKFVKKFLALRVIDSSATPKTATGVALTTSQVATLEAGGSTAEDINEPGLIGISNAPESRKYLHDRGLYLDYLSPEAVSYLNQVLDSCTEPDLTRINCILPYLPFVTINTTELASWSATGNLQNNASVEDPKTGVMGPITTGVSGNATGNAYMYRSNSGLVYAKPIDPFDGMIDPSTSAPYNAVAKTTDLQRFEVSDSGIIGSGSDPFTFSASLTLGSQPLLASRPLLSRTQTINSVTTTSTCGSWITSAPYVFNCAGATFSEQSLIVTNYNFVRVTSGGGNQVYNPCLQGTLTNAQYSTRVDAVYCDLYASPTVTRTRGGLTSTVGVTPTRTGAFSGTGLSSAVNNSTVPVTTHTTTFTLTGILASDIYGVNFGNPVETQLTPITRNNNTVDQCAATGKCTCNASQLPVYNFATCP